MIFFANSIWSPYAFGFSTWSESVLSLLVFIKGDLDVVYLNKKSRIWCGIFMACFFLIIISFFVNAFIGIMVHAYWNTQLLHGYNRKTAKGWSTNRWKYFLLWGWLFKAMGLPNPDEEEAAEGWLFKAMGLPNPDE